MTLLNEFKKFAMRGSIVDMAIGFTVGAAFSTIAKSIVNDILMPPIGLIMGRADFSDLYILLKEGSEASPPYATLADAQKAGAVTVNYGEFINSIVAFLIIAVAMFVIIRSLNRIEEELEEHLGEDKPAADEPTAKKCRFCRSQVAYRATRCPQCTSHLTEPGAPPAASTKPAEAVL